MPERDSDSTLISPVPPAPKSPNRDGGLLGKMVKSTLRFGAYGTALTAVLGGAAAMVHGKDDLAGMAFQQVAPTVLDGWANRDVEVAALDASKADAVQTADQALAAFEEGVRVAAPQRYTALEQEMAASIANVDQTVASRQEAVRKNEAGEIAFVDAWSNEALDMKLGGRGAMERVLAPTFMTLDADNDGVKELNRQGLDAKLAQTPYRDLVACEAQIPQMVTVNSQGEEVSKLSSNAREARATLEAFETVVTGCADTAKVALNTQYDAEVAAITPEVVLEGISALYDPILSLGADSNEFVGQVRAEMGGVAQDQAYADAVEKAESSLAAAIEVADAEVTGTPEYWLFEKLRPEGWKSVTGATANDFSPERAESVACATQEGAATTPAIQVNCGPVPLITVLDCSPNGNGVVIQNGPDLQAYTSGVAQLPFAVNDLCAYTGGQGAWKTSL